MKTTHKTYNHEPYMFYIFIFIYLFINLIINLFIISSFLTFAIFLKLSVTHTEIKLLSMAKEIYTDICCSDRTSLYILGRPIISFYFYIFVIVLCWRLKFFFNYYYCRRRRRRRSRRRCCFCYCY